MILSVPGDVGIPPLGSAGVSQRNVRIHPTAIVEDEASIGDGTSVWHHAHVRALAVVGAGCVIGKNVYVDDHVIIGCRCKLQNNVSVYNGVTIGNDVFVGPSATFTNDRVPRAFNAEWRITPTVVFDGASIGANATVVCGTTLGEYSMVAAGATVTRDVHPYQLVAGTPARHLGWVCRMGHVISRAIDRPTDAVCKQCGNASTAALSCPTGG